MLSQSRKGNIDALFESQKKIGPPGFGADGRAISERRVVIGSMDIRSEFCLPCGRDVTHRSDKWLGRRTMRTMRPFVRPDLRRFRECRLGEAEESKLVFLRVVVDAGRRILLPNQI